MTNSAEVQLIINAINNASRTIKEVEGDVSKMNKSTAAAKDFIAGMGVSLADFSNPAMMAGRAVGFVTDQVKQSINQFAEYGKQVESVSRKLGISAEEASKLIQVSDDLEVDYSTLTQAMKEGLKDGIVPSIDGLAELAKEYQKITDPTKRAAFAVEKFGKAGLEMQKVLEVAPDQLKEMGDAVKDTGLLMSQEGVEAAKKYRQQMDNLEDSVTGVKNQIGMALVPELNKLLEAWNNGAGGAENLNEAVKNGLVTQKEYDDIIGKINGHTMTWADVNVTLKGRMEEVTGTMDASDRAAAALAYDTQAAADAAKALSDNTMSADDAMKSYTASLLFNLAAAKLEAPAALELAYAMGLVDERTVQAYKSIDTLTAAFDENNDGVISGTENVEAYKAAVASLKRVLDDLPNEKTINVYVNTYGNTAALEYNMNTPGGGTGAGNTQPRAAGGPVAAGAAYIVGENGPEMFVPRQAGTIVPNQITNNWGGININGSNASPQDIARAVGREFDRRR